MRSQLLLSAVAALAFTSAHAADLSAAKPAPAAPVVVSPWDFTVGGGATTNYLFRGISQSDNKPSANVNAEVRYTFNDMFLAYIGGAGSSIKLTDQAVASPGVELDAIGGVRATFGNFGVDVGAIGYLYPSFTTDPLGPFPTNTSWWEGYAKLSYAVNDNISLGVNAFFTPSYINTGANAQYLSGTFAWKLPYDFALSGEFGHQWIGTSDLTHGVYVGLTKVGVNYPDYSYWNVGASYTYKIATLDLRYHDTNLSKVQCAAITGTTNGSPDQSKYCKAAFVATLSFSLQGKDLK